MRSFRWGTLLAATAAAMWLGASSSGATEPQPGSMRPDSNPGSAGSAGSGSTTVDPNTGMRSGAQSDAARSGSTDEDPRSAQGGSKRQTGQGSGSGTSTSHDSMGSGSGSSSGAGSRAGSGD